MAQAHGLGDRKEIVPLPHVLRQDVLQGLGGRHCRRHPLHHLLGLEALHKVVLRLKATDTRRAIASGVEQLELRPRHLDIAESSCLRYACHGDADARRQDLADEVLVEPHQVQFATLVVIDVALGDRFDKRLPE